MDWFESLMGFREAMPDGVRANIVLEGTLLKSKINGRAVDAGSFQTPTLKDLRERIGDSDQGESLTVSEKVADVQSLHQDVTNQDSVFQVASQFNCLEMVSPEVIPEQGVGRYQNDWTQGPACCISAGGGTIFRNYFVPLNGATGQSKENQIDCLSLIGDFFGNENQKLWTMRNGYCFPTKKGLVAVQDRISAMTEIEIDRVRELLMVGVQSSTEVTVGDGGHKGTQVFSSALPVAYSEIPSHFWGIFPRLILEATYEATLWKALENYRETGCKQVFLTLVGGGVFGNETVWIMKAINRSLKLFSKSGLDVKIVSYGHSDPNVARLVQDFQAT